MTWELPKCDSCCEKITPLPTYLSTCVKAKTWKFSSHKILSKISYVVVGSFESHWCMLTCYFFSYQFTFNELFNECEKSWLTHNPRQSLGGQLDGWDLNTVAQLLIQRYTNCDAIWPTRWSTKILQAEKVTMHHGSLFDFIFDNTFITHWCWAEV